MTEPERQYRGRPAAPGRVSGPLVALPVVPVPEPVPDTREGERRRLRTALDVAREELASLATHGDGVAGSILEFQIEMFRDPVLLEPVLPRIEAGEPAARAWRVGMATHLARYQGARDEAFRVRATDLVDMRDRVTRILGGRSDDVPRLPEGAILLAEDLTPSRFLTLDWTRIAGAALRASSPASHVAVLARARNVPLITGLGHGPRPADAALLDADVGLLVTAPRRRTLAVPRAGTANTGGGAVQRPSPGGNFRRTEAGAARVMVNVDDPETLSQTVLDMADGVGLVRTETLYLGADGPPDEDEQYSVYRRLAMRVDGRACVFRTLDVGGDKPLTYLKLPVERNPFLGLRGIRLCLEYPELFRPQVRALLRVAVLPGVRVMLPMVTVAEEYAATRMFFEETLDALRADGVPAAMPPLGIMVEVPAVALAPESVDADFYSIGSNDLIQYTLAAARDGAGRIAALQDAGRDAVMKLIAMVVAHGQRTGREVSLCGDLAADPGALAALLATGLERLSVAPTALTTVQARVRELQSNSDAERTG